MSISVFLSTVSDEFRDYRNLLVQDLTRYNVAVKVHEDFEILGGDMLDKLDTYIAACDAVVHLVGDMCGAPASEAQQRALLVKHSDLSGKLPRLGEALANGFACPYTQWEAWLALYHGKQLYIAKAHKDAPRGPNYAPTDAARGAQQAHVARLREARRYPFEFTSQENLAKQVFASGILDLLVKDYAEQEARGRTVAEGFIEEMAKRVAGDRALDLEGKQRAVSNAIEIYEKEIAGRPVESNLDDIVSRALSRAKEQVDKGQSGLARATLHRAAEEMRREEEERRERFEAGATTLYNQARDIALATYDGDAAAEAVLALAQSIHGTNLAKVARFMSSEAGTLYEYGRDRGSNVHLVAAIALRRELATPAVSKNEQGAAHNNLGNALATLGERESGTTARLEEAVAAYRAALEEYAREQVPLDWAVTQNNLGNALATLGERESGTARLEEEVAAYRAALEERTRERVPLDWAMTQNHLGTALQALGGRESGTARLEEAVQAYRAALEERTRERVPVDWAATKNNLGHALWTLGGRESGTARLEEAVQAYRAALEERTRERVPLDWAVTQNNLGHALWTLGERESGTARLEEAVQAYRAALEERTRERAPLLWATTQNSLGNALARLGRRKNGTARLEEAVQAYRAALEERTRERVPLDWAMTQNNLGVALQTLGERESGIARLEEAVQAYRAALEEWTRERVPLQWAASHGNQGVAKMLISDRTNNSALAEAAAAQIKTAFETLREGGQVPWAAYFEAQSPKAQAVCDRIKGR
jgi:tetratricopeptide (TPR) repeat protein